MGIFSRFGSLLKSNLNDMISKAEDPEKMLNQVLLDMKQQLVEAKKQVAVSIADEKRLQKQFETETDNTKEWERKAMLAVKAGNDGLAKEALGRKSEAESLAGQYQKQWELQKQACDKLKIQLKQLNDKIEEASRKKNILVARKKRAEAQKTIQSTMQGLSDTSAFDTFDRMSQKVDQMEAEAEAQTELGEEMTGDTLDKQFKELEAGPGADQALLELKAKMGMLPAPQARAALPESTAAAGAPSLSLETEREAEPVESQKGK